VEGNPVFIYHDAFNPNKEEVADLKERYVKGTVSDVEVKNRLNDVLREFLAPIRERRKQAEREDLNAIVQQGVHDARKIAAETLERMRILMYLDYRF